LEGTALAAKALPNALAVMAIAEPGTLLNAPDVYMDKIAIGPGYSENTVDLDAPIEENIIAVARAKGVHPREITVLILERSRHDEHIAKVRSVGAAVRLITDGDVAGIIATTDPAETDIDIYIGRGGAPEGVLAASALRCLGGQMQGRLHFRNDGERERAAKWGITDLDRKYKLKELASGDVIFAATGVTNGAMLQGIHRTPDYIVTHSVVMRSTSGTVRWVTAKHPRRRAGR
jgi:fructose-1,6-bisphosphatase II / sedoheptulose-1,7-bisphosphatase